MSRERPASVIAMWPIVPAGPVTSSLQLVDGVAVLVDVALIRARQVPQSDQPGPPLRRRGVQESIELLRCAACRCDVQCRGRQRRLMCERRGDKGGDRNQLTLVLDE